MAKESRAKSTMGGGKHSSHKSKKSHKVHRMHVSRGPAGGFTTQHEAEPGEDGMPGAMSDPHPVNDMAALQQHMEEHMGDQPPMPQQAAPAAGGAPAGASPAPAAAGPAGM